jgi:probable rRNA maturation factor
VPGTEAGQDVILNRQNRLEVKLKPLREFERELRGALRLGRRDFTVCLVDDSAMRRLNRMFRGQARPTDVLSFPWKAGSNCPVVSSRAVGEMSRFLGDIAISVETARRNARAEGHALRKEIRWLILHVVLHLLGYNHETDEGQMTTRELAHRDRLGLSRNFVRRRARVRA